MNNTQENNFSTNTVSKSETKTGKIGSIFSNSCRYCALGTLCQQSVTDVTLPKRLANITHHPKPIHRGDHLFRQGDKFRDLYIVRSGAIKLYLTTHDGIEQIINFYYPGEVLSLDSIETGLHNSSALALDTVSVCTLRYEQIRELCRHQPDYYDQLFMLMAREIGSEHNMLLLLGQKPAEERLATFLIDTATRSNNQKTPRNKFLLSMTRHEIAKYLCLADETISRLLGKFAEDKVLKVRGREVEIQNFKKLQILAKIWQSEYAQAISKNSVIN